MNMLLQTISEELIAESAWGGHASLPLEERWFSDLKVRARNVLFRVLQAKTFGELLALDADRIMRAKNAGVTTCRELIAFRDRIFAAGPGEYVERLAAEKRAGTTNIPSEMLTLLSTRSLNVLKTAGVKTYAQLFALTPKKILKIKGSGKKTVDDLMDFAKRCGAEGGRPLTITIKPADPSGFESLADFVIGVADEKTRARLTGKWLTILRDNLALGEGASKKTLEEVGAQLNLTRERVRQIGVKIEKLLFGGGRAAKYATFSESVVEMFKDADWILPQDVLLKRIDKRFGWRGTSVENVIALMGNLGHKIEVEDGLLCTCDFERTHGSRYKRFLDYVNSYNGALKGYSPEGVREAVPELSDLKEVEYSLFVRHGMLQRMVRTRKARKVVAAAWQVEIKPLRARQYFAHVFGLRVGPLRSGYNKGTLRKDAILSVLMKAGPQGLSLDEILERCKKESATLGWNLNNVRIATNKDVDLDDVGTHMIGYDRGSNAGASTRYTLNTFFHDKETVEVLERAAKEIGDYMRQTGFGVVSVWKWWRKYRKELPVDLPKLGFYMMMRDVSAGGLEYRDYPKISMPGMDVCENVYGWELYQYFLYCGRQEAMFGQIMSFFVDCLGLQPSIALNCAFHSMGLKKVKDELMAPYKLQRPEKPLKTPRVLLGTVQRDPGLSLIKSSDKFTIHSDYFDDDGRALNHTTYVRMFMRALEKSKFKFSPPELAMLMDKGVV